MSVIHVSTADQFWSAISDNTNEIILDNDIDCNGIDITTTKAWRAVSFDGQGHTIFNLSLNAIASGMFNFGTSGTYTVLIKNVIFANILQVYDPSVNNYYLPIFLNNNTKCTVTIENIQMQGLLRGSLIGGRNITVNRSAFKTTGHKIITAGSGYSIDHNIKFSECYFDCSTISSNIPHYFRSDFTDCYFKGDFDCTGYTTSYVYFNICKLTTCVINNKFTKTNGVTFNLIDSSGLCQNVLYNSTLMGDMHYTPVSGATGLTDSELKDPNAVLAAGFPLIV